MRKYKYFENYKKKFKRINDFKISNITSFNLYKNDVKIINIYSLDQFFVVEKSVIQK